MTRKELIEKLQAVGNDDSDVCDEYDDNPYDIREVMYDEEEDIIKLMVDVPE